MASAEKTVVKKFTAHTQREGGGFIIRRPIGGRDLSDQEADPFLLLDELGPKNYAPGEFPGAPMHPHRGFDTVMHMLQGTCDHSDSMGNSGSLRAGDCQWMTAASGIEHDEGKNHPGGVLHGFQMWNNLPASKKMKDPAYQDVPAAAIPIIDLSEAQDRSLQCKVLVGSCGGTDAVIVTDTPVQYLDFRCKRGAAFTHPVPPEMETVILYVYHGKGVFNGEPASDGQTILFSAEGETVGFECTEALSEDGDRGGGYTEDLRFLLLCGKKLREPIARHGPFVMNTRAELIQAFTDYQNGELCKKKGTMKSFSVRAAGAGAGGK
jgi:redox-sensitive bicupin YhaK (pirin superfamily)